MSDSKKPEKPKRRSLGRGLDALLGGAGDVPTANDSMAASGAAAKVPSTKRAAAAAASVSPAAATAATATPGSTTVAPSNRVPVERIRTGRFQPRRRFDDAELDELAGSIRARGVLQPLLVRPHPEFKGDYELIAGERRWRASQRAQVHDVPVVVLPLSDLEALEVALVENVQRQDLTPLEEADGYARLVDEFKHTQEDLARVVGKSRSHVANMLRLRALPDAVKAYMDSGELTAGHARALLTAKSPEALAKRIVKGGLSVRAAEKLAAEAKSPKPETDPNDRSAAKNGGGRKDSDSKALEKHISDTLGLTTEIEARGERGHLIVHFKSLEQLDDLIDRLTRG